MSTSSQNPPAPSGIPPGMIEVVLGIIRKAPGPIRRRKILQALQQQGRTISLAGLNRLLDYTRRAGTTEESDDGVRLRGVDPTPSAVGDVRAGRPKSER